jgi:O-antigen/teichoic acid export membrane protein
MVKEPQKYGLVAHFHEILHGQRVRLQNLSVLVICNFAAAGVFFLANVKIANVIGKENFGNLAYAIALGMYGQVFVRYGMERTLVRDLIHYPHRFAEIVAGSLLLRSWLQMLVIFGLLIWKFAFDLPSTLSSWGFMAVVVACSLKSLDLESVYDAWLKMSRHACYNLIQRVLYFLLIWIIILWSPGDLSIACIGFGLLGTEIFYLLLQQMWAFRRIDFGTIKVPLTSVAFDLSKSNFWIWLSAMGGLSFGFLNQIVLKHYCGAAELGGYAASWQIAAVAALLLTQISRIGNPATARATRLKTNGTPRIRFLLRYSCVMLLTAAPICILVITFPEWILTSIFKPEYALAAGVLRVFGIYTLILSLGIVAAQYVVSARMERTYFASVILGGCLNVILCVILIPRLAGLGAALSLLIAHGFTMGLYWVAVIQQIRKQL